MQKGFLITFEGIDGCGKSTLATNLYSYLAQNGYKAILTKEPGGTPFGMQLRKILSEQEEKLSPKTEFLLFAADRATHIESIKPYLENGFIVISDRMADSSLAYQGYGRGLDTDTIEIINKWAMEGILPDLTFYLKIDLETSFRRIRSRKEKLTSFEKEEESFLLRVIQGYENIFAARSNVLSLDALKSQEELLELAVVALERFLVIK